MPSSLASTLSALLLLACTLTPPAHAQTPGVVYEPTPTETVARMLRIARVGSGDFVIDLGSGDGRIPIAAVRNGARGALGIELDAALIERSRASAKAAGIEGRVSFRQEDLFRTPLTEATVVTMYLLPEMNVRLRPRLLALRPGTRIVTHRFDIGDWTPDAVDEDGGRVSLWIVPANVAGRWSLRHDEDRIALDLTQRYQELSGAAEIDGSRVPLTAGRLRGGEIEFTVALRGRPTRFRGAVTGNAMQGTGGGMGIGNNAGTWQATRM